MADPPRSRHGRSPRRALQDRLSEECRVLWGSVDALLERHLERVASIALPAGSAREAPAGYERQASPGSAPGSFVKQSSHGSRCTLVSQGGGSHASLGSTVRSRTSRGLEAIRDDILSLAELDETDEASRPPEQTLSRRPSWKTYLNGRDSLVSMSLSATLGAESWTMEDGAERSTAAKAYRAMLGMCCGQPGLAYLQPVLSRAFACADWVYHLQEPERSGCLHAFVSGKEWTSICALVITLNAVFAIFSTDYDARHYLEPSNFLGETTVAIAAVNVSFMVFYAVEIFLKLCLHRLYFFCNDEWRWNIFDLLLVVFNVVDLILAAMISAADSGPTDLAFMRSLRILKLAKVLRIIRMFRIVSELRLIMNSVIGSMISLVWSFLVIVFIMYLFGILFVQGVTAHFYELQIPFSEDAKKMFGSTLSGMLTLYMSANGGYDWYEVYDLLASTGWKTAALFLIYIVFIQIAVLNIVTGTVADFCGECDEAGETRPQGARPGETQEGARRLCGAEAGIRAH
ncbi:unnamed protein product [Prorocentrum cordatum]|uniref:Ion transport domain-containing protein n=1 Tax=Prorocentrum cordatum TaxID=2364126 RepID=A0ABN9XMG4_9DINO|nr:unnamed protein product [Polarella glacialis]